MVLYSLIVQEDHLLQGAFAEKRRVEHKKKPVRRKKKPVRRKKKPVRRGRRPV
jgi:hypothetical protein